MQMLAVSTEKVNDPCETSVLPCAEGVPRPPPVPGRRASGPALGNRGVVFRRVVRAASGLALGNLGVVFRRAVRATED